MFLISRDKAWKALKNNDPDMKENAELILRDLDRTLVTTKEFNYLSNNWKRLRDMLYVICITRPDIGYTQGLNMYAGILLLNCRNIDSFNILSYLLSVPIISDCLNVNSKIMIGYANILEELVFNQSPKLGKYLKSKGYNFLSYIFDTVVSFFMTSFPYETELKILDRIIESPEIGIFKLGLSIFKILEKKMMEKKAEEVMMILKFPLSHTTEDIVFQTFDKMELNVKTYMKLKEKHMKEIVE